MTKAQDLQIISHWNTMIEGLAASTRAFYDELDGALRQKQMSGIKTGRVLHKEGGLLSANREYFEIRRNDHVFHICAAPFGNGFFVSWWLGQRQGGLHGLLLRIPIVGPLFARFVAPMTYYKIDTAMMFQSLTHSAVLAIIDGLTSTHGVRGLTELERRPTVRDLLAA